MGVWNVDARSFRMSNRRVCPSLDLLQLAVPSFVAWLHLCISCRVICRSCFIHICWCSPSILLIFAKIRAVSRAACRFVWCIALVLLCTMLVFISVLCRSTAPKSKAARVAKYMSSNGKRACQGCLAECSHYNLVVWCRGKLRGFSACQGVKVLCPDIFA